MEVKEKLALLEDIFELEEGELEQETDLDTLSCWDSMSKLSLIVLIDDEFGKKLTGSEIREFKTVKDILEFMK